MRLGRLVLFAGIEVGYVLVPVIGQASGRPVAGLDGTWLGLRLGIGLAP
jgi:hypothetical protein